MADSYDLRSALSAALPAAGPALATVKAVNDIGFKADPKNNDMKELFVGLDIAPAGESADTSSSASGAGPSAAQALLDYRRQNKEA